MPLQKNTSCRQPGLAFRVAHTMLTVIGLFIYHAITARLIGTFFCRAILAVNALFLSEE